MSGSCVPLTNDSCSQTKHIKKRKGISRRMQQQHSGHGQRHLPPYPQPGCRCQGTCRAGQEKLSPQNTQLQSSDALPAPTMILLPHSAFPFSAAGVLPQGSAPLHCPLYHLSGEQSPGSSMPGPREPPQQPGETTQHTAPGYADSE